MTKREKLRKQILKTVKEYHKESVSVPFIPGKSKVPYAGRVFNEKELVNLVDSSLDFWLTAGRYAQKLEKELAEFLGVKHALLVNSGSSANLLAISALTSPLLKKRQLKPGDEVITTACGFPTTLNPILQNQLKPVIIDVELGTYNIDVGKIEKSISRKTKAIFVAHTLGNPFDLEVVLKIAKKYNLFLIEDNCDALGSKYRKRFTGTYGHIATLSFYPAHHITMGEGGAVLTNDPGFRRALLSLRDWGRDCWCEPGQDNTCNRRFKQQFGELPYGYDHKYVYSHIGYNLKVTDLQAAVGVAQLKKLKQFIKKRQDNFRYLSDNLKKFEEFLLLPQATKNSTPSWFGFPILVKENVLFSRNDIVNYLEDNKIATRMLFGGNLTKQPAYAGAKMKIVGKLKNTDFVMNNLFWIGVYPGLTKEMLNYVCGQFNMFFKKIPKDKEENVIFTKSNGLCACS
ncbi:MAG: lipopolysaccharide biosynthesis protein RfbH [Candidatus Omnitrophica bacterium]|nr:lipopolysaccharide biosynthesis protein RfbH [Candidatus Omnitrophota bacterium]